MSAQTPKPSRRSGYRKWQYPDDMIALLQLPTRVFEVFHRDNEDGPSVLLGTNPPLRMMDLGLLTVAELDLFKKIINTAIEDARPLCEELDKRVDDALKSGDIRFRRLYRPKPIYVELEKPHVDKAESEPVSGEADPGGSVPQHDPGIQG